MVSGNDLLMAKLHHNITHILKLQKNPWTGEALFQTHENLEHLAMMQQVLGPIPEPIARSASRSNAKYFNHRWAAVPLPLFCVYIAALTINHF